MHAISSLKESSLFSCAELGTIETQRIDPWTMSINAVVITIKLAQYNKNCNEFLNHPFQLHLNKFHPL